MHPVGDFWLTGHQPYNITYLKIFFSTTYFDFSSIAQSYSKKSGPAPDVIIPSDLDWGAITSPLVLIPQDTHSGAPGAEPTDISASHSAEIPSDAHQVELSPGT